MVVIRLARTGVKKKPFYHVVVADRRNPRDGRFIEQVGYFAPMARGQSIRLSLNQERIDHWINIGAQASPRVTRLIKDFAVMDDAAQTQAQSVPASKTKSRVAVSSDVVVSVSEKKVQKAPKTQDKQNKKEVQDKSVTKAAEAQKKPVAAAGSVASPAQATTSAKVDKAPKPEQQRSKAQAVTATVEAVEPVQERDQATPESQNEKE